MFLSKKVGIGTLLNREFVYGGSILTMKVKIMKSLRKQWIFKIYIVIVTSF